MMMEAAGASPAPEAAGSTLEQLERAAARYCELMAEVAPLDAALREAGRVREARITAILNEFQAEHGPAQVRVMEGYGRLAEARATIRRLALTHHASTGELKPIPGVFAVVSTTLGADVDFFGEPERSDR
ncbi:MAG TPA: hypothetical protein VJN95_08880 [Gemmatimonadales bacterium]|nr:hypothetical protein [Gemmatimonadales bacterium]